MLLERSGEYTGAAISPNSRSMKAGVVMRCIRALSTATGAWRQVTDFGDRAIFIARRVS
jgi:hypothetical protein